MKRFISIFVFILIGTVLAEGEEMKFVTVLSSPVGAFAQLETANPTRAVQSPVVNFGTSRVSTGRIELKGAAGYIEDLSLQSGTELGGNAGEYRVEQGMEVGTGGRITGGRLMANEVDFSGALEGKSEVKGSLYTDEIAVAGAKADSLTIPDEVELTASSGEEEVLEWSNEYDCDYEIIEGEVDFELCINYPLEDGHEYACASDTCGTWNDGYGGKSTSEEFDYERRIKVFPHEDILCIDITKALQNPDITLSGGCLPQQGWESPRACLPNYSGALIDRADLESRVASSFANNLSNYYLTQNSNGDDVYSCSGPCIKVCTKRGDVTTGIGTGYNQCIESAYYSPRATAKRTLSTCRRIEYNYLGKKRVVKCKKESPTYDSYLLKSKTKTDSSSSEETTAGTCKHLRDIGYYD